MLLFCHFMTCECWEEARKWKPLVPQGQTVAWTWRCLLFPANHKYTYICLFIHLVFLTGTEIVFLNST